MNRGAAGNGGPLECETSRGAVSLSSLNMGMLTEELQKNNSGPFLTSPLNFVDATWLHADPLNHDFGDPHTLRVLFTAPLCINNFRMSNILFKAFQLSLKSCYYERSGHKTDDIILK